VIGLAQDPDFPVLGASRFCPIEQIPWHEEVDVREFVKTDNCNLGHAIPLSSWRADFGSASLSLRNRNAFIDREHPIMNRRASLARLPEATIVGDRTSF
jgi:hypothetical protein